MGDPVRLQLGDSRSGIGGWLEGDSRSGDVPLQPELRGTFAQLAVRGSGPIIECILGNEHLCRKGVGCRLLRVSWRFAALDEHGPLPVEEYVGGFAEEAELELAIRLISQAQLDQRLGGGHPPGCAAHPNLEELANTHDGHAGICAEALKLPVPIKSGFYLAVSLAFAGFRARIRAEMTINRIRLSSQAFM